MHPVFSYSALVVGFPTCCFIIGPYGFIVPAHAAGAHPFSHARERMQRVRQRGGSAFPLGTPSKVAAAGLLSEALRNDGSE